MPVCLRPYGFLRDVDRAVCHSVGNARVVTGVNELIGILRKRFQLLRGDFDLCI